MYRSRIDKQKRILFIEIEDFVSNEETLEAAKDFWTKVACLGKGATIICDITKFKNGSRVSRILLQKLMKLLESYEPKAVFRIVKGYSGAMLFDRAYNNMGVNYRVHRVESQELALELLKTFENIPPILKNPPSSN